MTKAILWDNDGVLVDTERLYFEATQQVLASIGIELTEAQYKDLFLNQGRGAWHLAAERGVAPDEVERLRTERNERYASSLAETPRLMPGVAGVLGALHGRYVMGVATSSRRDHFEVAHRHSGLLKYFDFAITADEVSRVKPDPELYVKAVRQSGVDRTECLAVEDSLRGLVAAKGAGIRCIVIPTPLTRDSPFVGADRVLDSVDEILTTLETSS